jgi:hypothetical protein
MKTFLRSTCVCTLICILVIVGPPHIVASSARCLSTVVQKSQCGENTHGCVARTFSIRTLGPFTIQNIFPMQSGIFRVTCVLLSRCKIPTAINFQQFREVTVVFRPDVLSRITQGARTALIQRDVTLKSGASAGAHM